MQNFFQNLKLMKACFFLQKLKRLINLSKISCGMRLQLLLVLFSLFTIGIYFISHNSIYAQEFKEYKDDSFDLTFQYPEEWDDNLDEEESNVLGDNFRSVSFDSLGENQLTIYIPININTLTLN